MKLLQKCSVSLGLPNTSHLTCRHDSVHMGLAKTPLYVPLKLDVAIGKHRNADTLPAEPQNSSSVAMWPLPVSPLSTGLTHLTALICSQLASPVCGPFWARVRPCTVKSCGWTSYYRLGDRRYGDSRHDRSCGWRSQSTCTISPHESH